MASRLSKGILAFTMVCLLSACNGNRNAERQPDHPPIALTGTTRTPAELIALQRSADGGDVAAMRALAAHYYGTNDAERGQHWLRSAARLGDCQAIELLLDRVFNAGMAQSEIAHWTAEWERLGCVGPE